MWFNHDKLNISDRWLAQLAANLFANSLEVSHIGLLKGLVLLELAILYDQDAWNIT